MKRYATAVYRDIERLKAKCARRRLRLANAERDLAYLYSRIEERMRKGTWDIHHMVVTWGIPALLLLRHTLWKKLSLREVKRRWQQLKASAADQEERK